MRYDDILGRYLSELRAARDEVEAWWEQLIRAEGGDRQTAERAVRSRWPLGPASHPRIVAVFRAHYLEIERMNEEGGDVVQPMALLLEDLELHDPALAALMQSFVFPSIGTDPDGNCA